MSNHVQHNEPCHCHQPPFNAANYAITLIGIDAAYSRYGEVSIEQCIYCHTLWLKYFIEQEHYTAGGKWFKAIISTSEAKQIQPQNALEYISNAPFYFYGGSYYNTTGKKANGKIYL